MFRFIDFLNIFRKFHKEMENIIYDYGKIRRYAEDVFKEDKNFLIMLEEFNEKLLLFDSITPFFQHSTGLS